MQARLPELQRMRGPSLPPPSIPAFDLSCTDLRGWDFSRSVLTGFSFKNCDLRESSFDSAKIDFCDFSGADLTKAVLSNCDLRGTSFKNAILENAVFAGAAGLDSCDFAGAILTGCNNDKLKFSGLDSANETSKQLQTLSGLILLACAYAVLMIGTTTDVSLLSNTASSQLPIVGAQIPLVAFYLATPILLLLLSAYFHVALASALETIATLPYVFPDGRSVDRTLQPWMFWRMLSYYISSIRSNITGLGRIEIVFSVAVEMCIVPLTLFGLWLRYLSRHDFIGTILQICCMIGAVAVAMATYDFGCDLFVSAPAPSPQIPNTESRLLVIPDKRKRRSLLFLTVVLAFISGFAFMGWGITANVASVDVSSRPGDKNSSAKGADLRDLNLSGLRANHAYFAMAQFDRANLRSAKLERADLSNASLQGARLCDADLQGAELQGADLRNADLSRADLRNMLIDSNTKLDDKWFLTWSIVNHKDTPMDLIGRDLSESFLSNGDLARASLAHGNLRGALLNSANLTGTALDYADLRDADLKGAYLVRARLVGADLRDANLSGANLRLADLSDTNINFLTRLDHKWRLVWNLLNGKMQVVTLKDEDLSEAFLRGSILERGKFTHVSFIGADLSAVNLNGAVLDDVDLSGANLDHSDLRNVKAKTAKGIIQEQLDAACEDQTTELPPMLHISGRADANCKESARLRF